MRDGKSFCLTFDNNKLSEWKKKKKTKPKQILWSPIYSNGLPFWLLRRRWYATTTYACVLNCLCCEFKTDWNCLFLGRLRIVHCFSLMHRSVRLHIDFCLFDRITTTKIASHWKCNEICREIWLRAPFIPIAVAHQIEFTKCHTQSKQSNQFTNFRDRETTKKNSERQIAVECWSQQDTAIGSIEFIRANSRNSTTSTDHYNAL